MSERIPVKYRYRIERLERLCEAERERAQTAWDGYRNALHELVDVKMKLEAIERVLKGETE